MEQSEDPKSKHDETLDQTVLGLIEVIGRSAIGVTPIVGDIHMYRTARARNDDPSAARRDFIEGLKIKYELYGVAALSYYLFFVRD